MSVSAKVRPWLELLRPPNLFTVPGDPLTGYVLALAGSAGFRRPSILLVMSASLCLYAAGLLANDYFDLPEDRRDRPERPLPRGAVRPAAVAATALALTAAGVGVAFVGGVLSGALAVVLAALVWSYNRWAKHHIPGGPLVMGLCRAGSLLMGAAVAGPRALLAPPVLYAAGGLTAIVAAITLLARSETSPATVAWRGWLPGALFLLMLLPLPFRLIKGFFPDRAPGFGDFVRLTLPGLWALVWGATLHGHHLPQIVSRAVGRMILGLLLWQSALCAAAPPHGDTPALLLLLAFPVASWVGRWFHGS